MVSKVQMSDTDTIRLIKEVKKHGCIWNPDDENYNDRCNLFVAWTDVAKRLDMPEDIIRTKWKNLRDFFRKEIKKNGDSLENYKGRWRHFKSLGFLLRHDHDDQTGTSSDTDQTEAEPIVYEPVQNTNLEVYLDEDPIPEKKFKADDEEDYDMMFLKSLTPFLKQLEPTRNLVVRSRMQDMLLNEIAAQNSARMKKS